MALGFLTIPQKQPKPLGNGWIIDAQMQWATAYGFPAAIGIAATWDLYVHQVLTPKIVYYGRWYNSCITSRTLNYGSYAIPYYG